MLNVYKICDVDSNISETACDSRHAHKLHRANKHRGVKIEVKILWYVAHKIAQETQKIFLTQTQQQDYEPNVTP